jgi:hypothetical protein
VADVEKFKDDMLRAGTSRAMVVKVLTSTKAILTEAMRQRKVAQNVALAVRPPKAKSGDRPKLKIGRDVPTRDEMRDILAMAEVRGGMPYWRRRLLGSDRASSGVLCGRTSISIRRPSTCSAAQMKTT